MDFFSILKLLGGLTFFLFGMKVMSGSLENMAGGRLEHSLQKVTASPILCMFLGAAITIAVQSSSATTVMLVGLVNSGIMTFPQTINVIFGANIGTTLTSWILSLSGIEGDNVFVKMLKPENFSLLLAFIGIILIMFSKKGKRVNVGTVFVGFAVLMYGMEFMKDAVAPLSETPAFNELLVKFNNPLLGLLVGMVFTGIIQSSAASIGILQALSLTGGVTNFMAIPIVMGQNIGTCATSLISCIGANVKAKRVAVVHIMIKIIGSAICLAIFLPLNAIFKFTFSSMAATPVSIALIHTVFNIVTTVILMPFSKLLTKFTEKLLPEKKAKEKEELVFLDERLLRSPSVAITECNNISKRMCTLARDTVFLSMDLMNAYTDKGMEQVIKGEDDTDRYEDKLGSYLVKLSGQNISSKDSKVISKMLHALGDFERLGDHAKNLAEVAREIHDKRLEFSGEAQKEIKVLAGAISEILMITAAAYYENDLELAAKVEPLEQVIDHITTQIKSNHIERLQHGSCTIELGFVLSDLLTNYERISDHCSNIAVAVIEVENDNFDTHEYLSGVKCGNVDFDETYESYCAKYAL